MKAVIRMLNDVIEHGTGTDAGFLSKGDARLALHAIETQGLAINALRLVVENAPASKAPEALAALAHGRALLDLHDKYVAKHSEPAEVKQLRPNPADSPAAKKPVADQDVSDLV